MNIVRNKLFEGKMEKVREENTEEGKMVKIRGI